MIFAFANAIVEGWCLAARKDGAQVLLQLGDGRRIGEWTKRKRSDLPPQHRTGAEAWGFARRAVLPQTAWAPEDFCVAFTWLDGEFVLREPSTRKRTALQYLFEPLPQIIWRSFRET